ncbi:RIIa domain-containing protein 1 isoform X3 [Vulpes lagopus]|uniref:RIIa domain-containing protein 1 isoform X3 n=1 Tax=Vulpes lagopus TaxID=494514 RepID=UPI001BCA4549|nr:RIIa domain-containing protein 1 isoform X3 [Vulpes lagopus]
MEAPPGSSRVSSSASASPRLTSPPGTIPCKQSSRGPTGLGEGEGERKGWGGAGPPRPRPRRPDDPDKMATLQGGLLGPDPGALSPAQQEQLRDFKVGGCSQSALTTSGRCYGKLAAEMSACCPQGQRWRTIREMFLKRPDNIQEFAADYFTDPRLPNKIHMQLIKEKKAA